MDMKYNPAKKFLLAIFTLLTAVYPCSAADLLIYNPKTDTGTHLTWYDAMTLGVEGKGWKNTASFFDRLPVNAKGLVTDAVWDLSHCSSGMSVRFGTDAKTVTVTWTLTSPDLAMPHMPATGVSGIDLYARGDDGVLRYCNTGRPTDTVNTVTFKLCNGNEYVLYLPLYNGVKELKIGTPAGYSITPAEPEPLSKAVVFYGTSITQGGCASRPGMAATTIVGRKLDVPVINLGFSGSGKMELSMAEMLSELDPAVYVLDCLWNMKPELVSERVGPFIHKLRESRPDTPIILVEDSNIRNLPTKKGKILYGIYEKLKQEGDNNLYFLSNKDMLGEDREATVDGVHLTDLGNYRQADTFIKCLEPILNKKE